MIQPLKITGKVLRNWMFTRVNDLPPGMLHHGLEMPLFPRELNFQDRTDTKIRTCPVYELPASFPRSDPDNSKRNLSR